MTTTSVPNEEVIKKDERMMGRKRSDMMFRQHSLMCHSLIKSDRGGTALLLIDVQNDFHPGGALAIDGADEDATRMAETIRKHGQEIREIYATMDTHQLYHIASPMFWTNAQHEQPKPFTIIKKEHVLDGIWYPVRDSSYDWALTYLQSLEESGRFDLIIWPPHCLLGTQGHNIKPCIMEALLEWESKYHKSVHFVVKGNYSLTEHYSAIKCEVPVPGIEEETGLNEWLVSQLQKFSRILICGQALSHCVNFTVRDLVEVWNPYRRDVLYILEDASSSVPGFEAQGQTFLDDMRDLGLTITSTRDLD